MPASEPWISCWAAAAGRAGAGHGMAWTGKISSFILGLTSWRTSAGHDGFKHLSSN